MKTLVQINLTFACGGLIIEDGIILDSAPIFKGWRGCKLQEFVQYYKSQEQFIDFKTLGEKR